MAVLRSDSAGYTECNCQGKSNYADYDTGYEIGNEFVAVITSALEQAEEFRLEYIVKSKVHFLH